MTRTLATKRDVRPEELVEVGLASPRTSGRGGVYDKFRSRVIFPIRDQSGHAVGLGGRLLEGDGPKYLNSPATPLFDKSRTLYLIDKAKGPIRKPGQAVIVEGYTDALMAHQAGFDNVVASLGTALTPGQVALLTRYASRIALAYDVDAAGEKAGTLGVTALAGLIGQLQSRRHRASSSRTSASRACPTARTPTRSCARRRTPGRRPSAPAKPLVEYLIDHHAERFDLKTATGRIGFVEAVMPALRDIDDPLRRDEALGEVRRVSGVEERALRQVLERRLAATGPGRAGDQQSRITADSVLSSPDALPIDDILRAITPVESELLRLLLLVPDAAAPGRRGARAGPAAEHRRARAVPGDRPPARADDQGIHPPFDGAALLLALDDETAALARALYAKSGPDPRTLDAHHIDYEVDRLLLELEDDQLRDRSEYNEAAQGEAERAGDAEAIDRLELEGRQINEARRSLDRRRDQTRLLRQPPEVTHVR